MAYIENLNCYVAFFDRNVKMKCNKCGFISQDSQGANPSMKQVDFGPIKTTVKCPNCDNDTYNITAYFEPYVEDNIVANHDAFKVQNVVEEDFEDDENLDDVSRKL